MGRRARRVSKLLRAITRLPDMGDPALDRSARIVHHSALLLIPLVMVSQFLTYLSAPDYPMRWFVLGALLLGAQIAQIVLVRLRRPRAAGWTAVAVYWVALTAFAWTAGGVEAPAATAQLVVGAAASLLLGWREGLGVSILGALTVLALGALGQAGVLPEPQVVHTPLSRAFVLTGYVAIFAAVQGFVMWQRDRLQGAADRMNASLEARVAERTEELAALVEELREANLLLDEAGRAKSDFLASMSHELRTPLNSIIGFSGLLERGLAGELNEEQERQIGMISASGKRLLALVNQVLDLARIESGERSLVVERFCLAATTRHVCATLEPLARRKGLQLTVEANRACEVLSDRLKVEQVLMNLVDNAVRHTEAGAVRVTVSAADGLAAVAVADTGPGIASDLHERVFEDFYQVPPADGGKREGTGLGLAVSRHIAGLLGGEIRLESAPGAGSTFTFALPRQSAVPSMGAA